MMRWGATWKVFSAVCAMLLIATAIHAGAAQKSVLMLLWRGETEADLIFKKRLKELGFDIAYTQIDAHQDRNGLVTVVRGMESDFAAHKFDLVYSHGTTVTEVAAATVNGRIPQVFDIVFDPLRAGFVKSMAAPGGNLTGVTNGTPVDQQLDAFHALVPFRSLCLIFNSRETNSAIILGAVKDWAAKNQVTLVYRRVAPETEALNELMAEFQSHRLSVDAVYAGADSYVATKATEIRKAIGDQLPLFGGTETFLTQGWLATFAPTFEDLGTASAEQAARLLRGDAPGAIPVILPPSHLIVSKAAVAVHHITVPPGSIFVP